MSRNHRRWEEPPSSRWEPGYRRSYSDERSRRRYAPPTELLPRSSFNYWRDDFVAPTSQLPRRSYERESYNDRRRDDGGSRYTESSYSRRRRDFGPGRDREDWVPRRDRDPPHRHSSHHRHPTYTPSHVPQPTIRARSPIEPIPSFQRPALLEPPRKVSPPSNTSSQPLGPSPGYLSLSQEPSELLRDPTISRKLLVLDLNGTLLIRSARSRTTSGQQLRSVQPRPYMQSFRQYLFCLETQAWLDTMVWSSAQPHSVDDMVDKVFGTAKRELKAVWNRKSLGLSEADYHRKAVTTKDLTKPWALFASALCPERSQGYSSSESQVIHSAFTTLLLDDSPHKAVLQPYSHVCIPEYDSARRQHDLRSFLATKEPKQNKKAKRKDKVETQIVPELLPRGALSMVEKESYDVTLLALIGILEAVKLQSNIAGWIRRGGLWATQESGVESGVLDVKHHSIVKTESGKMVLTTVIRTGKDAGSISDPSMTPEQAHQTSKMWFDDSSVVAFWVTQGRRALMELGIQIAHGVTG